jgi:hypothetical protein
LLQQQHIGFLVVHDQDIGVKEILFANHCVRPISFICTVA